MQVYEIKRKIMVKDNRNTPKILFIDKFNDTMVALKPIIGAYNKPLWFPREIVFEFNQKLFDDLNDAYLAKNEVKLASLWSQVEKWQPEEN